MLTFLNEQAEVHSGFKLQVRFPPGEVALIVGYLRF